MPVKKEIAYPIFLECCPYTEGRFWSYVFEDLAYGKPPYGAYISNGFLCCGQRHKSFSYKIEGKDPKLVYDEVFTLLSKRLGVLSPQDKIQQRKLFSDYGNTLRNSRTKWGSIRRKKVKELLLELFVLDMKKKVLTFYGTKPTTTFGYFSGINISQHFIGGCYLRQ